jgi:membrane protease YdiL (CAAX protease family)
VSEPSDRYRLDPQRPSWLDPQPAGPPAWLEPRVPDEPPPEPRRTRVLPPPKQSRVAMLAEFGLVLLLAFAPLVVLLLLRAAASTSAERSTALTVGEAAFATVFIMVLGWLPILVLAPLLRRNGEGPATIGLHRPTTRDAGAALLLVVASFAVVYALAPVFSGLGRTEVQFLSPDLPVWFLSIQALLLACTAGVTEEVLFRGYAQTRLEQLGLPGPLVVLLPTTLWSVLHAYQGLAAVPIVLGLGLLWSVYFHRTRRLWPLVIAHILYDLIGLVAILAGR